MGRDINMYIEVKGKDDEEWKFVGPYFYSKYVDDIVPMSIMSGRDYDLFDWLDKNKDGSLVPDSLSFKVSEVYDKFSEKWTINYLDFNALMKVRDIYGDIPETAFASLPPFSWDDGWDVDVDESLVYLYLFRYRVKMVEKFVDAVMVYYDDLSLYMYENVRLVWWIDC